MRSTSKDAVRRAVNRAIAAGSPVITEYPAQLPPLLNGFPVVRSQRHPACHTVMVERPEAFDAFAVATWWPALGTAWQWGHYFDTRADADKAFDAVAKRNEVRS